MALSCATEVMPQKPPPLPSLIVFSFFHTPFSASFKSLHQVSALLPGPVGVTVTCESAENWISTSCRSPSPPSEKPENGKKHLSFLLHIKCYNIVFILVYICLISSWSTLHGRQLYRKITFENL